MTDYERSITVDLPFGRAVERAREALAEQGFGVLTEIDVQATLRDKRGIEMEPYVILGACNPDLAHRALEIDRGIGVLLPCNVVVRAPGDRTTGPGSSSRCSWRRCRSRGAAPIAAEADQRLTAVLEALPTAD